MLASIADTFTQYKKIHPFFSDAPDVHKNCISTEDRFEYLGFCASFLRNTRLFHNFSKPLDNSMIISKLLDYSIIFSKPLNYSIIFSKRLDYSKIFSSVWLGK